MSPDTTEATWSAWRWWRRRSRSAAPVRVDLVSVLFLFVVCVIQLAIYVGYPMNPAVHATGGWEGWWDQSQYLRSARALAAGNLDASSHWYPLGYPLLGAPFAALGARDPFLWPNLAATLVYAGAYLAFFRPLIGTPAAITAFFAATLLPVTWLTPYEVRHIIWLQFVIPWNTVPVGAMFMCMLLVLKGIRGSDAAWKDAVLGACAAAVVLTRPVEVLVMLPFGVAYLAARLAATRPWASIGAAVGGAALVLAPAAVLELAVYDGFATPYVKSMIGGIGLSATYLPQRALAIFVDAGRSFGEPTSALFTIFPWLIVLGPLALCGAAMRPQLLGPATGAAAASILTYLSFNDFSPLNIVRFHLIHYLAWMFPVIAAAGIYGAMLVVRRPASGLAALLGVAVLASMRVMPTPIDGVQTIAVASTDGAVRYGLRLPGERRVHALDIRNYVAAPEVFVGNPVGVVIDGQPLAVFSGYRVVQFPDRARVLFNRNVMSDTIYLRLKDGETGRFTSPGAIEPVVFRLRLETPWAPHSVAP